jgi:hypothetical protein
VKPQIVVQIQWLCSHIKKRNATIPHKAEWHKNSALFSHEKGALFLTGTLEIHIVSVKITLGGS